MSFPTPSDPSTHRMALCDFESLNMFAFPADTNKSIMLKAYYNFRENDEDGKLKDICKQICNFFTDIYPESTQLPVDIDDLSKKIEAPWKLVIQNNFSIYKCHHQNCNGDTCKQVVARLDDLESPNRKEIEQKILAMNTILVLFFNSPEKNLRIEFFTPDLCARLEPIPVGLPNFRALCCFNSTFQVINCLCRCLQLAPQNQAHIPLDRASKMLGETITWAYTKNSDGSKKAPNKKEKQYKQDKLAAILAKVDFPINDILKANNKLTVLKILSPITQQICTVTDGAEVEKVDERKLAQLVINHFTFLQAVDQLIKALNVPSKAQYINNWQLQSRLLNAFENYLSEMEPTAFRKKPSIPFNLNNSDAQEIFKYLFEAIGLSRSPKLTLKEYQHKQLQIYDKKNKSPDSGESRIVEYTDVLPSYHHEKQLSEIRLDFSDEHEGEITNQTQLTFENRFKKLTAIDITPPECSEHVFYCKKPSRTSAVCQIQPNETGRILTTMKLVQQTETPPDGLIIHLMTWGDDFCNRETFPFKLGSRTKELSRSAVALINAIDGHLIVKIPICQTSGATPKLLDYKIKSANIHIGTDTSSGHYTYLEFREDGDVIYINDEIVQKIGNISNPDTLMKWVFDNNISPTLLFLFRVDSLPETPAQPNPMNTL